MFFSWKIVLKIKQLKLLKAVGKLGDVKKFHTVQNTQLRVMKLHETDEIISRQHISKALCILFDICIFFIFKERTSRAWSSRREMEKEMQPRASIPWGLPWETWKNEEYNHFLYQRAKAVPKVSKCAMYFTLKKKFKIQSYFLQHYDIKLKLFIYTSLC